MIKRISSDLKKLLKYFHVKFNLILQLIKRNSSDLKKLLKYFNGTKTFTFLFAVAPSRSGLPNKLTLYLKELELSVAKSGIGLPSGGSSRYLLVVHLVYIDKESPMNLDNYLNILLNCT